ncbi:MAG: tetratricopeptide repeat protein, partial [Nitrospirae bacterium]|nr:tetratricopeptide repeat protein [Nitrospirota bacterium]
LIYWLIVLAFKTPYFQRQGGYEQHYTDVFGGRYTHKTLALAISLLFVCHPVQTEAVTYIVQRLASLATLFYLLAIVMYIKSRLASSYSGKAIGITAALLSTILAMKTKEISFTLPVVITLFEFMFFTGGFRQRCLYVTPFLLTMSIIPMTLIGNGGSMAQLHDLDRSIEIASSEDISRWDYLFTQFRVIVTYMRLLVLPLNQNLDYDYPIYRAFFTPAVLISLALIISIVGIAFYLYRLSLYSLSGKTDPATGESEHISRPYLRLTSFGILWFFVTLSVESSVIPIADVIFEHRLYLPSVGAFIAITTGTVVVLAKGAKTISQRKAAVKRFILPLSLLILTILSIATYARNIVWQDEVRLWSDVVKKSPNKARPNLHLADEYVKLGYINDAIRQYQTAISLKPDYADAHMSLSRVYASSGRYDDAVREAQVGMKCYKDAYRPDQVQVSFEDYFANAHFSLGNAFVSWGRMEAALKEYLTAIELKPDYAEAYVSAGNVYTTQGHYDEAIKEYQTALEIRPGFPDAQQNLSFVQQKKLRREDFAN